MSARGRAREPGEFFGRNSKDGQVSGGQSAAHGANLSASAEAIHEAGASEGLHVMKDDGDASAGGIQDLQDARKFVRKTARRPGEGSVLDEDPASAPGRRLEAQGLEGIAPAMNLPGNAANFQVEYHGAAERGQGSGNIARRRRWVRLCIQEEQ